MSGKAVGDRVECVCLCVCDTEKKDFVYVHVCLYVWICVKVCVCVCVWRGYGSPGLNVPLTKIPEASVAASTQVKCFSDLPPHPHHPHTKNTQGIGVYSTSVASDLVKNVSVYRLKRSFKIIVFVSSSD